MTFLKNNKYHFAGLALVVLLFGISVAIRKENLSVPLSRHHEWITAHTLITCEIWAKNGGPSAYHFSPVYTYPGEGNQNRKMLGGVVDEKGDVYYVSYPPFAFLFAYYSTLILGGPDTENIRTVSLVIHLLCTVFIYLIAAASLRKERQFHLSVAGLTGAFLYLFSTGNLWGHGNLYFADMLVQLFVVTAIYLTILFVKHRYSKLPVMLGFLFLTFFLATYTEWLGLFLSFFCGIFMLIYYFIEREKRFLGAFVTMGAASLLAVTMTLFQYASIAGWDKFEEVSQKKYTERSGHESAEESPNKFNLENDEAYAFMIDKIDHYYLMAENFTGIFAVVFLVVVLIPNARRRIEDSVLIIPVLIPLAASILLHYYLFFNFNSLHDFSSMKTGLFIILAVTALISMTESALSLQFNIAMLVVICVIGYIKGSASVEQYNQDFPLMAVDWNRIATGDAMRTNGRPEAAIFMNITVNPELVYAAGHNVFPVKDTSELLLFMHHFNNQEGQYYHHQGAELEYIQEFKCVGETLVFTNRYKIGDGNESNGRVYQK